MKIIKVLGFLLIFLFVFLICLTLHYNIFENAKNIKYLFPIGASGFFCLAYSAWCDDKKSKEEFSLNLVTFRKNSGMSLFVGILLLLFTIIL